MKKKIILTLTACLFAAGSIINVHLAQNDHNLDVSLADISVMAQADGEKPTFCSKEWTLWGVCIYLGNLQNDCFYIASNCFACDCDGVWDGDL